VQELTLFMSRSPMLAPCLVVLEMGPVYEAANPGLADALNANKATFAKQPHHVDRPDSIQGNV